MSFEINDTPEWQTSYRDQEWESANHLPPDVSQDIIRINSLRAWLREADIDERGEHPCCCCGCCYWFYPQTLKRRLSQILADAKKGKMNVQMRANLIVLCCAALACVRPAMVTGRVEHECLKQGEIGSWSVGQDGIIIPFNVSLIIISWHTLSICAYSTFGTFRCILPHGFFVQMVMSITCGHCYCYCCPPLHPSNPFPTSDCSLWLFQICFYTKGDTINGNILMINVVSGHNL